MGDIPSHDREILRDLARQYVEVASDPVQNTRRDLWRRHNSHSIVSFRHASPAGRACRRSAPPRSCRSRRGR